MMIVADIGATKIVLAVADVQERQMTLSLLNRYEASAFGSIDEVLSRYLAEISTSDISSLCAAVAGPVMGNVCRMTNLGWDIDGDAISRKFGLGRAVLLNDLVASGYGLDAVPVDKIFNVHSGEKPGFGNRVLLSPGTGLGETIIHYINGRFIPVPSEGGHTDFAPYNGTTMRLWSFLKQTSARVSVESLRSGSGMFNIFRFLAAENGVSADEQLPQSHRTEPAAQITSLALEERHPLSLQAVALFLDILASEAGNMALTGLATGGVFIGGGIVPRIVSLIDRTRFATRFSDKEPHRALLEKIPLSVVTDTNLPLYGAASYLLTLQDGK